MKKIVFLLIVSALWLSVPSQVQAQIFNGSFATGNFNDWQTLGAPTVINDSGTQAQIQSTSGEVTTHVLSVDATLIESTLGVILPQTSGVDPTPGSTFGYFDPTNGQAIYQTFSLGAAGTLSFDYAFGTDDYAPYDSVGYVIDGTYYTLANPPAYTGQLSTPKGSFTTKTVNLSAGSHTIAFVAYNTNDHFASSSLYVTNVSTLVETPEPGTWAMLVGGLIGLFALRKFRKSTK